MATTFDMNVEPTQFHLVDGKYEPAISSKQYNGLSIDPVTGKLVVTKGPNGRDGVGGTMNTPGNGIAGESTGIGVIRCNSTVTRLQANDPYQEDGGKLITDIITQILAAASGG